VTTLTGIASMDTSPRGLPAVEGSLREWVREHSDRRPRPGSVLIHAPSTAFQAPGGGENQLVQTARHLEAMGVDVRLFSPWVDRLEDFRLLHLFGMSREGLELATAARRRGIPVALSPICWLETKALYHLARSRARGVWDLAKWSVKGALPAVAGWRDALVATADVLLPNSRAEADQLVRLFRARREAIHVVPNGVDPRFEYADAWLFRSIHGDGDFVLYAGRVEPRKNVHGLILGARRAGFPLVIIGDAPPGCEAYLASCSNMARGVATWYEGVDHDDPRLASAFAAARVFALPSWFETPGLAALEAALAGTAVVVTPHGCTREYFGGLAEYAGPDRIGGIAAAVGRAWDDGPRDDLRVRIKDRFLWADVARRTAEAYDQIAR
jgi:glycosyltransferase involved in cell wall biosynthesis